MRLSLVTLCLVAGLLSGCVMSKKECQTADWYAQGLADAKDGKDVSSGEQHRQFCLSKHQVSVDLTMYHQGWQAGMREYCTYSNGYERGNRGRNSLHENICSAELRPALIRGYNYGMCRYNAGVEVRKLENTIDASNRELEDMDERIKSAGKDTKKDDIANWRERRADARSDLYKAQARLPYAIVDERRALEQCEARR